MKWIVTRFLKRPAAASPAAAQATSGLAAAIAQARELHRRGELDTAAARYRELLAAYPSDADIHYRYGNLLKDQNALDKALDHYASAIALRPDHAHAHCNRAVVLGLMNRLPAALESYDAALAIDPSDAIALCNRAHALLAMQRSEDALAAFEAAIAQHAGNFPAHFGRAALLQAGKRWSAALHAYDHALELDPRNSLALYNRGTVNKACLRPAAALADFGLAIAIDPGFAQAHAQLGVLLQERQHHAAALLSYDRALELDVNDVVTRNNRGVLLQQLRRRGAALADYDRALELNPMYADAWFNRGSVLKESDDLSAALASYDRVIALDASHHRALINRGVVLQSLGRPRAALDDYRKAIELNPESAEAHYNFALASLSIGDYAAGWHHHEWRWLAASGPVHRERRDFCEPLWLGAEVVAGQTLLLYGEQGLGDSLLFVRYAALVAQRGARVILEVPPPLVSLCATLPGVELAVAHGAPLPHFDAQCPLMSLALAFQTDLTTIPFSAGYLVGASNKIEEWRSRMGDRSKPKIGLVWSGNRALGTNRRRHFELASILEFLPGNFDYFCLQTEVAAEDRAVLDDTPRIIQYQHLLHDFGDTAALCECLDLVLTIDTSVAHLAGALGKPTWVLLPFVADWRWLTDRDDSPWYDSVRLFRQTAVDDWRGVFERVAVALRSSKWLHI